VKRLFAGGHVNNPAKGYCAAVIAPKIEKFRKIFKDRLKTPE
jgi:hypothetical protein